MNTILITGANRGLGLALTTQFANNNWKVYATCRNVDSFPVDAKSDNIELLQLDVGDRSSIDALRSSLDGVNLDVVINNAGVADTDDISKQPTNDNIDEISNIMRINAVAPRIIADTFTPNLQAGDMKTLVTISTVMSSFAGANSFTYSHWPYSASKAALNFIMLSYAGANPDITSALIHPGWLQTDMGGPDATMTAEESAADIYALITEGKIKPNQLTNSKGEVIPF